MNDYSSGPLSLEEKNSAHSCVYEGVSCVWNALLARQYVVERGRRAGGNDRTVYPCFGDHVFWYDEFLDMTGRNHWVNTVNNHDFLFLLEKVFVLHF